MDFCKFYIDFTFSVGRFLILCIYIIRYIFRVRGNYALMEVISMAVDPVMNLILKYQGYPHYK